MGTSTIKPIKIKLNNNTAKGMYILLSENEIKYTKEGETKPPNRIYKIQIEVEAMFKNKRCRGKQSFNIQKGTSIIKAVSSLLGKKDEMSRILKERGTLKTKKVTISDNNTDDRTFETLFKNWISKKEINSKPNTVRVYKVVFNTHLKQFWKLDIDKINENIVQKLVNEMINKGSASNTIKGVKRVLKQVLDINDVSLNWKKIELPKDESERKYTKSYEDTLKIVNVLKSYHHVVARGVFEFLLTGRRVNEILRLTHDDINYKDNTFTIPRKHAKTNKDFTFNLNTNLINAIKSQKTSSGEIFKLESRQMLEHFKAAMASIGIYDMVLHDLRSMVAQTALDSGADIYEVSKMLGHQKVATTEARYIEGGAKQAQKAQNVFDRVIGRKQITHNEEIIDVEIEESMDELTILKKLYPKASLEQLYLIIEEMHPYR